MFVVNICVWVYACVAVGYMSAKLFGPLGIIISAVLGYFMGNLLNGIL